MLTKFRNRYPQGCLISELVTIDHGKYIVRTLVQVDGVTLATGLAAAATVEQAEDHSRNRALAVLDLDTIVTDSGNDSQAEEQETQTASPISKQKTEMPETKEAHAPVIEHQTTNKPKTSPTEVAPTFAKDFELTPPQPATTPSTTKVDSFVPAPGESENSSLEIKPEKSAIFAESDFSAPVTNDLEIESPTVSSSSEHSPQAENIQATSIANPEPTASLPDETGAKLSPSTPVDFSDIIAKTDIEMKRLGWTSKQGRDYLLQTYGKRSRQLLSDEELLEFLHYLETLPNP